MRKDKIKLFGIILIFCFAVCSPMIQMHIASDTYNLMDLGYFEYPSHYFLRDARFLSAMCTYIAGILNLSYPVYIVAMEILAVCISSVSVYVLYNMIIEKTKETGRAKKIVFLIGSILIVFNYMALEYFLFAESFVMCLSVLLSIMSAKVFLGNKKLNILKSTILLLMASFCYQGSMSVFIAFVMLMMFIDKENHSVKDIAKKVVVSILIYAVCCIINILAIHIMNAVLGSNQDRVGGSGSSIIRNILNFGGVMKFFFDRVIIANFNLLPRIALIIFISISTIIIALSQKSSDKILKYVALIVTSFIVCIVPMFFMQTPGMDPRGAMAIGSIMGTSIIFLNRITDFNAKEFKYIMIIFATVCFICNVINTLYIFNAHIVTNKKDAEIGAKIKEQIEEYETRTGETITKVSYCTDEKPRYTYEHYKDTSFTSRALNNEFCVIEALNYFCSRKFEEVKMDNKIYEDNFKDKNWDDYSNEQIIFKNNTMYICMY